MAIDPTHSLPPDAQTTRMLVAGIEACDRSPARLGRLVEADYGQQPVPPDGVARSLRGCPGLSINVHTIVVNRFAASPAGYDARQAWCPSRNSRVAVDFTLSDQADFSFVE